MYLVGEINVTDSRDNKLKDNKSPGTSNISAELWKAGREPMIDVLHKICNIILKSGEWLANWTESIVIPLPKRGMLGYVVVIE